MNAQAWSAIIAAAGFLASLAGALMIVSYRAGRVEAELRAAAQAGQRESAGELRTIADRLTRIEGMFELRLKD